MINRLDGTEGAGRGRCARLRSFSDIYKELKDSSGAKRSAIGRIQLSSKNRNQRSSVLFRLWKSFEVSILSSSGKKFNRSARRSSEFASRPCNSINVAG